MATPNTPIPKETTKRTSSVTFSRDATIKATSGVTESPTARRHDDIALYRLVAKTPAQIVRRYIVASGSTSEGVPSR